MFYLTTHSTYFIYSYMASDIIMCVCVCVRARVFIYLFVYLFILFWIHWLIDCFIYLLHKTSTHSVFVIFSQRPNDSYG